jgi:putative Ca2+/H+ antiporter (TMEM165/GDT1 family)
MFKCLYFFCPKGTISGAGTFPKALDFIPNFHTQYVVFCAVFRRSLFTMTRAANTMTRTANTMTRKANTMTRTANTMTITANTMTRTANTMTRTANTMTRTKRQTMIF